MIVTDAACRLPNLTRVPVPGPVRFSMKLEPVIVTSVPPVVRPLMGDTLSTNGESSSTGGSAIAASQGVPTLAWPP